MAVVAPPTAAGRGPARALVEPAGRPARRVDQGAHRGRALVWLLAGAAVLTVAVGAAADAAVTCPAAGCALDTAKPA